MRDRSDRYQVQTVPAVAGSRKRIGSYLIEAGLLTTAQLHVALNDQKITEQTTGTRMQLGEIVAARGWLKEQTIEYFMQKIVLPERQAHEHGVRHTVGQPQPDKLHQQKVHAQNASRTAQATPRTVPPAAQVKGEQSVNAGQSTFTRREAPIAKPLPPVNSSDSDVNWVG